VPNINIPRTAENNPEIYGYQTGNNWVGLFEATLDVTIGGTYTFTLDLGPADTAFLWVGGTQVIATGCNWGSRVSGTVNLDAVKNDLRLIYVDDGWQDEVVLSYQGPDTSGALVVVPPQRLWPAM